MSESSPQPEGQLSAAPDSTPASVATLPRAWQPITPRGIAAFSRANAGRLGVVQLLVAIAVVASVLWFLSQAWFPITRQAIRRGSFRTVRQLIQRIEAYVARYNRTSHPFTWTATADSILAKLHRLAKAISGTQH